MRGPAAAACTARAGCSCRSATHQVKVYKIVQVVTSTGRYRSTLVPEMNAGVIQTGCM